MLIYIKAFILSLKCDAFGHKWSYGKSMCRDCRMGFGNHIAGDWFSSPSNKCNGWDEEA